MIALSRVYIWRDLLWNVKKHIKPCRYDGKKTVSDILITVIVSIDVYMASPLGDAIVFGVPSMVTELFQNVQFCITMSNECPSAFIKPLAC